MQSKAATIEQYLDELPDDRKAVMKKLRQAIKKNLPKGFKETMSYGMIGYVVPHSLYAEGYHCSPELPLPFMNIASQKNFIAVYHMYMYADPAMTKWFQDEYAKLNIGKLDMGKSCVRLKNLDNIPYELFAQLAAKITPEQWIARYEKMKPPPKKKK